MQGFGGQIVDALRRSARRLSSPVGRRAAAGTALLPERSPDRYLGGVAGGIARWLDVDPLVVRLGFAVGALYFPWLVVVYTAAWILLPDARTGLSLVRSTREPDGWPALIGVLALGSGATRLAPDLGPDGDSGLRVGVLLCLLGVMLLMRRTGVLPWASDALSGSRPHDEGEDAASASASDLPAEQAAADEPARSRASTFRDRRRAERRPPSYLGWFALSGVVLVIGVIAAIDYGDGGGHVSPGVAVAMCLVVVGAALVLAAWRGRARTLLPVGVALLPLWVGWSMNDVPRFDGQGHVRHAVSGGEPLPAAFEHGYGEMDVDLSRARFEAGDRQTLRIGLTAGTVRIDVPRDVFLEVDGRVGAGDVEIWDEWRVDDTGLTLGRSVALRARDYQERQRCFRFDTALEPEPTVVTEPAQVGESPSPTTTPSTTVPPELPFVYRDLRGEPCTPPKPVENPAHLELDLEVGIGTVEIHRV